MGVWFDEGLEKTRTTYGTRQSTAPWDEHQKVSVPASGVRRRVSVRYPQGWQSVAGGTARVSEVPHHTGRVHSVGEGATSYVTRRMCEHGCASSKTVCPTFGRTGIPPPSSTLWHSSCPEPLFFENKPNKPLRGSILGTFFSCFFFF